MDTSSLINDFRSYLESIGSFARIEFGYKALKSVKKVSTGIIFLLDQSFSVKDTKRLIILTSRDCHLTWQKVKFLRFVFRN